MCGPEDKYDSANNREVPSRHKTVHDIALKSSSAGSQQPRSFRAASNNSEKHRQRTVRILGTRGIPGGHGGFESFAQDLSLYLVARGWAVTVYCQKQGDHRIWEDEWRGVRLVNIAVPGTGSASTIKFDWYATLHSVKESGVALVLGYNTAVFSAVYRLRGVRSIMNMDGLEWKRAKYGWLERAWFFINEWFGCWISNALVADHPRIADHLATRGVSRKTQTIAYGSRTVANPDKDVLVRFGVEADEYVLLVARPEPENSILEIVRAFSAKTRGVKLLILGAYSPTHPYQKRVLHAASPEVLFPGAVYDPGTVDALRAFCALYVHGHTVGGTNPALVEAMGAGAAVLAHANHFNQWVAGEGASYFSSEVECSDEFSRLLGPAATQVRASMRQASRVRHSEAFVLDDRLADYLSLLDAWSDAAAPEVATPVASNT